MVAHRTEYKSSSRFNGCQYTEYIGNKVQARVKVPACPGGKQRSIVRIFEIQANESLLYRSSISVARTTRGTHTKSSRRFKFDCSHQLYHTQKLPYEIFSLMVFEYFKEGEA